MVDKYIQPWILILIYGIMSILSAIFMWKFVPETKGRTLKSIEELWKKK